MRYQKIKTNSGFTLTEVLIVITLLVILSLGVLLTMDPITQFFRGYDTVRKSDLQKLKTAYENYYTDHDCYPPDTVLSQCGTGALEPYLDKIPCDPSTKEAYTVYTLPDGSSCNQKYAIYAELNNSNDVQSDDITYCYGTIAVASTDMNNVDIIRGCSGNQLCQTIYGCRSGACVVIAEDSVPTCSPNSCDPTCGVDCSKKNRRGAYTNECRAF